MVSHQIKPKNRKKRAKGQISRSAGRSAGGGKGASFVEDDDLDTEEELHINVPSQLARGPKLITSALPNQYLN